MQSKETDAPNLVNIIKWFNKISRWVSTEIVSEPVVCPRSVAFI